MLILPAGTPAPTPTPIDLTAATITNGGDWAGDPGGGASKLNDGDTDQALYTGVARAGNSNDVDLDLTLAAGADLTEFKYYGPNNGPMHEGTSTSLTFTVYYSTDSGYTSPVQIGQITGFDGSPSGAVATIPCSGSAGKPVYIRMKVAGGSSNDKFAGAEVEATGVQ